MWSSRDGSVVSLIRRPDKEAGLRERNAGRELGVHLIGFGAFPFSVR